MAASPTGVWASIPMTTRLHLARVIAQARRMGSAKFGIQIAHSGRKGSAQRPWEGALALKPEADPWPTIAASPIPFGEGWHTPREVTEADMERVRAAFVSAAQRCLRIGFDEIELHMAHGYLAHGFMSPISNKRTDQYGGSFENRMRFPLSIARAVRADSSEKRYRWVRALPGATGAKVGLLLTMRLQLPRR